MNEIICIRNETAVCDSLQVAQNFGKRHDNILREISALLKIEGSNSAQEWARCFKESTYKDSTGKSNKMYYMNRDGFTFLVMGFTGQKANEWKWKYITAFNRMESIIREKQSPAWQESRRTGITARKTETDAIKRLVEYATAQGSSHPGRLYTNYTRLTNQTAGVSSREAATEIQLSVITVAESIIAQTIDAGIEKNKPYKEIYQDCKRKLAVLQGVGK